MLTNYLKQFAESRPLSVLVAVVLTLLFFISSIRAVLMLAPFLESGAPSSTSITLFAAGAVIMACIQFLTLLAFYRDSQLGYRFTTLSLGAGLVSGLACGYLPAGEMTLQISLLGWMSYDLYGFNTIAWLENKLKVSPPSEPPNT